VSEASDSQRVIRSALGLEGAERQSSSTTSSSASEASTAALRAKRVLLIVSKSVVGLARPPQKVPCYPSSTSVDRTLHRVPTSSAAIQESGTRHRTHRSGLRHQFLEREEACQSDQPIGDALQSTQQGLFPI